MNRICNKCNNAVFSSSEDLDFYSCTTKQVSVGYMVIYDALSTAQVMHH